MYLYMVISIVVCTVIGIIGSNCYVCTCVYMYVCLFACLLVCMYVCMYVHVWMFVWLCMFVCNCVCVYVCVYVCTYSLTVHTCSCWKLTPSTVHVVVFKSSGMRSPV